MRLGDTISLQVALSYRDENGDTVERSYPVPLGKCIIMPNDSAREIKGQDGKSYIYSYVIMLKKPKPYPIVDGRIYINMVTDIDGVDTNINVDVPIEGATIHLTKEDRSIDRDCTLKGFVTLRNWLKIWV